MITCVALPSIASADVTTYGTYEEWIENAGDVQEMTFAETELSSGTFLTDQLAHTGITFREDDWVQLANGDYSGVRDDWIIQNFNADVTMWIDFTAPITSVAVDTPQGSHSYQLRLGDTLVADLPWTVFTFSGFVSDQPFDAIRIKRNAGGQQIAVDNLLYSTIIPGPSGLTMIGIASLLGARRRRH